jgi:hypothetical protein
MGKKRAYSAKLSITSGDRCRASLPGLALLLDMGACGGPWGPQAIGPNPVPTISQHMKIRNTIIHIRTRDVSFSILIGRNSVAEWLIVLSTYHLNSDPK